ERAFQSEFDELNVANRTANTYAQKIFSVFFPSIEFLGIVSSAGVILVGAHLISSGSLEIGTLFAAIYLLQLVFQPLQELSDVDGNDLRDVQLRSYRRQLGVVLQDPFLFSGTIADNIRFARPDASDEQVRETAAAIGVERVAARLKGGLDHEVREGGAGLSAGERQLISIARALLADPRILILDEATSNIDRPTEILIERALDRL